VAGRCQGIKLRFVSEKLRGAIAGSLENRLELNNFQQTDGCATLLQVKKKFGNKNSNAFYTDDLYFFM
jgi:hypothetical protein